MLSGVLCLLGTPPVTGGITNLSHGKSRVASQRRAYLSQLGEGGGMTGRATDRI